MAKEDNSKLVAVLSYLFLIGWIIALIINLQQKTRLGSFHIRQTLMLMLAGIVVSFIPIVNFVSWIVLFIFWLIGLIGAINGEEKEIPLIGKLGQDIFKGL